MSLGSFPRAINEVASVSGKTVHMLLMDSPGLPSMAKLPNSPMGT